MDPGRVNGLHDGIPLLRTAPSLQEQKTLLANLEPDVVYGEGAGHTADLTPHRPRESRQSSHLSLVQVLTCGRRRHDQRKPGEVICRARYHFPTCDASGAVDVLTVNLGR